MTSPTAPNIVVGVDGSKSSNAALQWAGRLAQDQGGTVAAVMAWNIPTGLMVPLIGMPVEPTEFLADNARIKLDTAVESSSVAAQIDERRVMMGSARAVLTEASGDYDMLVIGRTGNSRLKQRFVGSTASYCVRRADCPVVIVDDARTAEQTIVVAVDGSPSSIEALVWGLGLGDSHEVIAVYSHDEWELDELALDDQIRADLDARADKMLAEAVQTATERSGADSSRVTRQIRQGDPRTTLIDQADPANLLVLGAQGHSGLARWALGSLADYAVQHAPGAVAVWR